MTSDVRCRLRQYAARHAHQIGLVPEVDLAAVGRARLLSAFDAAATCPLSGFHTVADYYHAGSSGNFIPHIRTPTLFLVAADDPFLGSLPVDACRSNDSTVLAVTAAGGHCAHLQGLWPLGRSWSDDVVMQFLLTVGARLPLQSRDSTHVKSS